MYAHTPHIKIDNQPMNRYANANRGTINVMSRGRYHSQDNTCNHDHHGNNNNGYDHYRNHYHQNLNQIINQSWDLKGVRFGDVHIMIPREGNGCSD